MRPLALGTLAMILAAAFPAFGEDPFFVDFEALPSTLTPTSAVWGRPLEGGAIRTLFVAPQYAVRDAALLRDRLDMNMRTVALWDAHTIEPPTDDDSGVARLLDAALERRLDLIVLANVELAVLPDHTVAALLHKIREGTGLLLVHPRGVTPPLQSFLDSISPVKSPSPREWGNAERFGREWPKGLDALRLGTFGEGRVVIADLGPAYPCTHAVLPAPGPALHGAEEHLDTYLSVVAKAARWAAGRDNRVRVSEVVADVPEGPNPVQVPPSLPRMSATAHGDAAGLGRFRAYIIRLDGPADQDYRVRTQVRRPGQGLRVVAEYDAPLPKGTEEYPVYVATGPGAFYLDVWLLDGHRVAEWFTDLLNGAQGPAIEELTYSKRSLRPNDVLDITAKVRPSPARLLRSGALSDATRPAGASIRSLKPYVTVYARATDGLGRVVAHASGQAVLDEPLTLRLDLSDLLSRQLKVEVFAVEDAQPTPTEADLCRAVYTYTYIPVRPAASPRFGLLAYAGNLAEHNGRARLEALAALGVDSVYVRGDWDAVFRKGVPEVRVVHEIASYGPAGGRGASPSFWSAAWRDAERARLRGAGEPLVEQGVRCFSLGQGNRLPRPDGYRADTGYLTALREYLRGAYKRLDLLNATWGTQFESWDQVAPAPLDVATALDLTVPWVDARRFGDHAFIALHAGAHDVLRRLSPKARAGFVAHVCRGPFTGHDWHAVGRELDLFAATAHPLTMERVRCCADEDAWTGLILPRMGKHSHDHAGWYVWHALLHDFSGAWWPEAAAGVEAVASGTPLGPDNAPLPAFQSVLDEVRRVRAGMDAVVAGSERDNCGIALYDSRASCYLTCLDPALDRERSLAGFMDLLKALGHQFGLVASEDVEDGALGRYDTVILPACVALSDRETAAIREHWRRGGHVIADVCPGRYDETGAPRAKWPLAEVFGIEPHIHDADARSTGDTGTFLVQLVLKTATCAADVEAASPGLVEPTGGAGVGGLSEDAPLWITQEPNEALAVLMNHGLDWSSGTNRKAYPILLRTIFRNAGITPVEGLRTPQNLLSGEAVCYRYGDARILGLLKDPPENSLHAELDLPGHWFYEWGGSPKPFARDNTPVVVGGKGYAAYVGLPYRVKKVIVDVPEAVSRGGRVPVGVSVIARKAQAGRHLVRVEISPRAGPDKGVPLAHYSRDVECFEGVGETYIPLAINERAGTYRITARDVLTGVEGQAKMRVTLPFDRR